MRIIYALAILLSPILITAQVNMNLLGNLDYQALHQSDLSDVWGYVDQSGNEYALIGVNDGGVSIVDISDPANPSEVFFLSGTNNIWRDIFVWNNHAYITTEAGGGLSIIDLSTLPSDPNLTTAVYNAGSWASAHNLFIDENGICYIFGADGGPGGVEFLDLNPDPMAPVPIGQWNQFYTHDGMVRGDTLYAANVNNGFFSIVDVSDKSNPVLLGSHSTGNNFTHNVWVSDDGDRLFTTDEVSGGFLGAYDISDLSDIQELDLIVSDPGSGTIPHNTHFKDDYIITSYYTYGVTVHDVSRPTNVIEVGHYDTSPLSGPGFGGCWGVYPFLPSEKIIASDVQGGLFIFEPVYTRACWLEGDITDANTTGPISGATIELQSTDITELSELNGSYATGYHMAGMYTVIVGAAGYEAATVTGVQLVNGQVTDLDVQLVPLVPFAFNGQVTELGSGTPIENAKVVFRSEFYDFDVSTDVGGNYTIPQFFASDYDVYIGHWGHINTCEVGSYDANSTPVDFELEVGYHDDFSVDLDWEISGNATSGVWARGEPQGQNFPPFQIVPFDDILWDCGTEAYITGIFGQVGLGAVAGTTILTSPVFDATTLLDPYVNIHFWFTNIALNIVVNDSLLIELSNGIDTVLVEAITPATNEMMDWFLRSIKISDHLTPTTDMRLHLTAKKPFTNQPELLEVVVDLFRLTGQSTVSVEEQEGTGTLNVFPNPSNGAISINAGLEGNEQMHLEVLDLSGRIVFSKFNALKVGNNELNLELPGGVYLISAYNTQHRLRPVRIVVQ